MTDEESCKIDQLLVAFATAEEASAAFQERFERRLGELKTEMVTLSRTVDGYLRAVDKLNHDYEYIVRLVRLMANDRIRDTIPSPAPTPDEERTNPGNGG